MHGQGGDLEALCAVPLARRQFLLGGASGVIFLAGGALLPAGCRGYPTPRVSLRVFNAREYTILNTAAECLLGVPGKAGPEEEQVDVAANVDAFVSAWHADAQRHLRTMLRIFEHGTYLFDLQRKRFTRLDAAQQERYAQGWMNSTLGVRRSMFRALKALAALGYYQDPRTWRRLGYDGPWLGRVYVAPRAGADTDLPVVSLQTLQA